MKICFHTNFSVTPNYIGGTERFLIKICKEMVNLGHEPFIVCSSFIEEIEVEGIKVIGRIPDKYKDKIKLYENFSSIFLKNEIFDETDYIGSLKRLSEYTEMQLDGIEADIYHLNSFASASFLIPSNNILVTNHENNLEYNGYWGDSFFDTFALCVRNKQTELHKYKYLFVPSQYYANFFSKEFSLNIDYIHLGIHLEDFKIQPKIDEFKKELFSDNKGVILLFPSRFQLKQKGHDIAIKAASLLKSKGIDFKIIFTGLKRSNQKYIEQFQHLIKEYNIEDRVKITTFSDIMTAYNNCDIVISTEKYCSYGLSISESLSLGIPTVLSDIPTYHEIGNGYKNAIFFKSEDYKDLADKLIKTISNSQERNVNDAIKFRRNNDIRDCAKKYSDVYFKMILFHK